MALAVFLACVAPPPPPFAHRRRYATLHVPSRMSAAHRQKHMKLPYRYLSALFINIALPWVAYRLAQPHRGPMGALAASAAPLIAWIVWDLYHSQHFDALSAIVLAGIVPTLLWALLDRGAHRRAIEDPIVSGASGLAVRRPMLLRLPI